MKVIGRMTYSMALARKFGLTTRSMKVSTTRAKNMVKAATYGQDGSSNTMENWQ